MFASDATRLLQATVGAMRDLVPDHRRAPCASTAGLASLEAAIRASSADASSQRVRCAEHYIAWS
jgi:hypothetical protein